MPLTDYERALLSGHDTSEYAVGFRAGANCEARMRQEEIPAHLKDLCDCVESLCELHPEDSAQQIAETIYYIFHEPMKKNWFKRHQRRIGSVLILLALTALAVMPKPEWWWSYTAWAAGVIGAIGVSLATTTMERYRNGAR